MAIMALPEENWMPTNQMAYFTVDTTKDTDTTQKPVTPTKPTEKSTLISPQPTKVGVTSEGVVATTVKEEVGTTASETATREENITAETKSTVDTFANAGTNNETAEEKEPVDRTKLIIIIVVCLLTVAGIVFSVYKKKK